MTFQSTDSAMPPADRPPSGRDRTSSPEPLRLMAFGSPQAIAAIIKSLHKLRFAEPNDWSKPVPTERAGEMVAVLTKKIRWEKV